ncbi:hypothetical protein Pmani_009903 [Petrolisthes manimaculis]|uniref:Uncharacterized protein n=1 Tax=Petrolisthes manimaculis TaxID=1843537 RepID=A0AAE1UCG2_9EUCA|nr:hypothetical protein Pmani_009903 [Petrolisthes manimaculis]
MGCIGERRNEPVGRRMKKEMKEDKDCKRGRRRKDVRRGGERGGRRRGMGEEKAEERCKRRQISSYRTVIGERGWRKDARGEGGDGENRVRGTDVLGITQEAEAGERNGEV